MSWERAAQAGYGAAYGSLPAYGAYGAAPAAPMPMMGGGAEHASLTLQPAAGGTSLSESAKHQVVNP